MDGLILWLERSFYDGIVHPSFQQALGSVERGDISEALHSMCKNASAYVFMKNLHIDQETKTCLFGARIYMQQNFGTLTCGLISHRHGSDRSTSLFPRRKLVVALEGRIERWILICSLCSSRVSFSP